MAHSLVDRQSQCDAGCPGYSLQALARGQWIRARYFDSGFTGVYRIDSVPAHFRPGYSIRRRLGVSEWNHSGHIKARMGCGSLTETVPTPEAPRWVGDKLRESLHRGSRWR